MKQMKICYMNRPRIRIYDIYTWTYGLLFSEYTDNDFGYCGGGIPGQSLSVIPEYSHSCLTLRSAGVSVCVCVCGEAYSRLSTTHGHITDCNGFGGVCRCMRGDLMWN